MSPTSTTNRRTVELMPENKTLDIEANNKTVAILIKLFPTSMAANNFLGFFRSVKTS
jgi:hypothetical protein